ncbi:DUF3105 domain-containing protein [Nocardioides marinus]|uniref:DUF3105 domain-containing protein n=1 Tax=Nocardioides marinus TaxID=374514 RepID=A0A7Y9YEB5_9ACTN|nr:hypothetical protein [Nocardioides marinus]
MSRGSRLAVLAVALLGVLFVMTAATVLPQVAERLRPEPVDLTLDAVEVFEDLPTTHTDEAVEYPTEPPVGGPHAGEWLDCGTYDEQVPAENLVHDLEHGTVVIAHDPDLGADDVARLAELLPQNGILTPWVGLDAPVVVVVWERRLALTGADDPRLELFIAELGNGETAPEPRASCAGGIEPPRDPGLTQV